MSWVSLSEAVGILDQELGCDSFIQAPTGQLTDTGLASNGVGSVITITGSPDLTGILVAGDLVILDWNYYSILNVTSTTITIAETLTANTDISWAYVKEINIPTFLISYNKRLKALNTAYNILARNTTPPDVVVQSEYKEAQSKLACLYYSNAMALPNQFEDRSITSKSVGDMSVSYDRNIKKQTVPQFIQDILGSYYLSPMRGAFFEK